MKVLLIPPVYQYNHHYPSFMPSILFPTGFAYVAAVLKEAGHEVYGLNLNNIINYPSAHDMIEDRIAKEIETVEPDLVALGGLCTDYSFIKDSINIIRSISKSLIVLGGGIVTHDAEYIFNLLKPDYYIIGEAEEAIVNIVNNVRNVRNGNTSTINNVNNIGYWQGNKAIFTKQDFNYKDLDSLPFPDYEPFKIESMQDYILTARWAYRRTRLYPKPWVIHTARSCIFTCTFCIHGRRQIKYRTRSIDNVMKEIGYTYNKYKYNILIILDELFAINKARMTEFCNALIENKKKYGWDFDWSFSSHFSSSLDKETLMLAKESGCFFSGYGLESASPTVIESMDKKITPEQAANTINLTEDVGISLGCNLIFGDPAETENTVLESLQFMDKHCKDIDLNINAIRPYPGSKLFDDCISKGIIKDKFNYYENIDKQPWNFAYNMTAMPNRKWLPLLDSIVAYGQLYPWIKPTMPIEYKIESEFIGKQVCKVWIECPHCKQVFVTRELLALKKSSAKGKASIKDIKLIKDAVVKALRLINVYYFSFRHPVYKILKSSTRINNLLWKSFFSTIFFTTGCNHCGKAVKVVMPMPFTLKSFSVGEIKRRLNLA